MAKRGGFFSTVGTIWRLLIWGLAAIFVVAIWIWYTGEGPKDDITVTEPPADATPARAEETPEAVAEEEASTPEPNPAEGDGAALQEGTGLAETRPVDSSATGDADTAEGRAEETPGSVAAEEAGIAEPNPAEGGGAALQEGTGLADTRPVEGSTTEEAATATGTGETAPSGGTAADAQQGAVEAASGTASEETIPAPNPAETGGADIQQGTGLEGTRPVDGVTAGTPLPAPMTEIPVAGDDNATYAFVGAARWGDGLVEMTTARTENGETVYVTRRVTCDPLGTAVIAQGSDPDKLTEVDKAAAPAPVAEGSPEAALASYACSLEF